MATRNWIMPGPLAVARVQRVARVRGQDVTEARLRLAGNGPRQRREPIRMCPHHYAHTSHGAGQSHSHGDERADVREHELPGVM
jgi:hypothetical protein